MNTGNCHLVFLSEPQLLQEWEITDEIVDNGNNEKQVYSPKCVQILQDPPRLQIKAEKLSVRQGLDRDYISARLVSKTEFLYGTFHIKARLPMHQGSWPAIWTLPSQFFNFECHWPEEGELDIVEGVTADGKKDLISTVHWAIETCNNKTDEFRLQNFSNCLDQLISFEKKVSQHKLIFSSCRNGLLCTEPCLPCCGKQKLASDWHIYHMKWTPTELVFWFDNHPPHLVVGSRVKHRIPNVPHRILLNLAIGGDLGGIIDDACFPQFMQVESVKWEANCPEAFCRPIQAVSSTLPAFSAPDILLLGSSLAEKKSFKDLWETVEGVEENGLGELQTYSQQAFHNVLCEDVSSLCITPTLKADSCTLVRKFISGKMISKQEFLYGTFRIRCRIPMIAGISVSISLVASTILSGKTQWPEGGQVSILDSVTLQNKREFQSAVHWKKVSAPSKESNIDQGPYMVTIPPDSCMMMGFSRIRNDHALGWRSLHVEWKPESLKVWFDKDAPHLKISSPTQRIPTTPAKLCLGLSLGGIHTSGPVDLATFSEISETERSLFIDSIDYWLP